MSKYNQLLEFVCELIDVQVKKYVKLAHRGVGPDARINAALVYDEVNELLEIAQSLLKVIEKELKGSLEDTSTFDLAFQQVKFYIEQEKLRAYAGWLLDANNIHATVDDRTDEQLKQLEQIAQLGKVDFRVSAQPVTPIQLQCQHDSHQIASYILKLAKDIRTDPTMKLDEKIPHHAQIILRKNATTRYMEYSKQIDELYSICELLLKNSTVQARITQLTKESADIYATGHAATLKELLLEYRTLVPNSRLFASEYKPLEVAAAQDEPLAQQKKESLVKTPVQEKTSSLTTKPEKNSIFSSKNLYFWGGVVVGGLLLVSMLLPYITQSQEESLSLTPNNC
ncbi:hypothetical protein [Legionella waltersii]|uniref:Uncharacterized protein n=1 Tax=Legionella waltersii TaxID=66969 RepID=A0A0W1A1R6_9GAMM|nr:hypothetical protein [Legionella waltersii]KTD75291.1 hypothetical protein Lwal_3332 [Legionella waltersii]SNV06960.1 Uncharacterised protein [Legionella waltersii]